MTVYRIIQDYTWLCWLYRNIQNYTGQQNYTGLYWTILDYDYTELFRTIEDYIGLYKNIKDNSGLYRTRWDFNGLYRIL